LFSARDSSGLRVNANYRARARSVLESESSRSASDLEDALAGQRDEPLDLAKLDAGRRM
jgi:hypothetical protein